MRQPIKRCTEIMKFQHLRLDLRFRLPLVGQKFSDASPTFRELVLRPRNKFMLL